MMKKKDWQAVQDAKNTLCLGDHATLSEIKQAYHRLCRKHHPDHGTEASKSRKIYEITEAYELLMKYCAAYRFPLVAPEGDNPDLYDPEDWWMARFGETPFWGGKPGKRYKDD